MKALLFSSILYFVPFILLAQPYVEWQERASMPERVTNNAVTIATVEGSRYIYSFAGMDSTKSCTGDHLRSFRYDYVADEWESIAPLPDPMGGKIAAAASTVKNKIYIIGGYHLSENCSEISSAKVHIYDPETNTYLADGADLPKAIDDHVQAVWQDSLIYVITGWSNTNNVFDVQIYNPQLNTWESGTSIPSQTGWRAFGASGTIIGDTIYFAGGAGNWNGSNFPPLNYLRKGYINPGDPTNIQWLPVQQMDEANGYRMGASSWGDIPVWFGGSDITYNFDGIAYDNSGGVPALGRVSFYSPETGEMQQIFDTIPPVMDLRGVAKVSPNAFLLVGGMGESQEVSNRVFSVVLDSAISSQSEVSTNEVTIFPNPTKEVVYVEGIDQFVLNLFDTQGKNVLSGRFTQKRPINLGELPAGVYYLNVIGEGGQFIGQKLVVR